MDPLGSVVSRFVSPMYALRGTLVIIIYTVERVVADSLQDTYSTQGRYNVWDGETQHKVQINGEWWDNVGRCASRGR